MAEIGNTNMTNSIRHTPKSGITSAETERLDKQFWHRSIRHNNKIRVRMGKEPLLTREVSNVWSFGKDGKYWWGAWCEYHKPYKKRYKGRHVLFVHVHSLIKK